MRRLATPVLVCGLLLLPAPGRALAGGSSFEIDALAATVRAPTGATLEDARLRVGWQCFKSNALIDHLSPTGSDTCGPRKSGEVIVPIAPDGSFSVPRISERHRSLFSKSGFRVAVEVLHGAGESIFERDVIFDSAFDPEIHRRLRSLHLVRLSGGEAPASLRVRLGGDTLSIDEALRRHPHSEYSASARYWLELPESDREVMLRGHLAEAGLTVDGRDLVTAAPGFGRPIHAVLLLELRWWLFDEPGRPARVSSCVKLQREVDVTLAERNPIPAAILEPVELIVDLDEPTSCWSF